MSDYWFYLSYARIDESNYLKRFYQDLSNEFRQRTGTSEYEVGYFDVNMLRLDTRFDIQTIDALQKSRILIPMYSPAYFNSEFCGKEWQFFRLREEARINKMLPDTRYHSAILPVLWQPEERLPQPLPAVAAGIQYTDSELGEEYVRYGLLHLMKINKYRDKYREFLFRFVDRLYDITTSYKLLPLENPPSLEELTNAFKDPDSNVINASSVVGDKVSPHNPTTKNSNLSEPVKKVVAAAPEKLIASVPKEKPRIFISYRRNDSEGFAGRLFDQLSARFGEDQIFMDIDTIEPGEDFIEVIEKAVSSCEILIAVIGKGWLTSTDESGRRRLDIPEDFVRVEILTALERNIRVIPILVQGATMPRANQLPDALTKLARRNALELSSARWKYDADRLIAAIEKVLGI